MNCHAKSGASSLKIDCVIIPASRTPLGSTYSPEPFFTLRTPLGKFVLPVGSTPLILYSPWGVHLLFVDSSELGKLN